MTNTQKNLGSCWAIVAIIEAAESIGIDPKGASLPDCCAIADQLGQRAGVKASGRTIDPRKVQAILDGAL